MRIVLFFPYYIKWHYTTALKNIVLIWRDFTWFIYHFFSIPVLLRTLFSPWQKIQENYDKNKIDIEERAGVVIINFLMRFVGAFLRLIFIAFGFVGIVCLTLLCAAFFVIWLALPGIVVSTLLVGVIEIVK